MPSGAELERNSLLKALGLEGASIDGARLSQLVDSVFPVFTDVDGNIFGLAVTSLNQKANKVGGNTFSGNQYIQGKLGVGVAPTDRQPFNTYVGLTPGMPGTKDKVGNALVSTITGDFSTGETGSNPSFAWGLNTFTQTSGPNGGAGLNVYNLIETAVGGSSGTIPVAVGLMSEVAHLGVNANQHVNQMISHLVGAPKKKDGAVDGTATTVYGLKIESVSAAAAGAVNAFAIYVEGGISRFNERIDIEGEIQSQSNSIVLAHNVGPGANGGGRLVVQNSDTGGSIVARLGKPTATFQVTKASDGSVLYSFNETQLGFWKSPVNRKNGWTPATGTATRTTFDTTSVTLPQLAERVKALIDDLHSVNGYGLLTT